MASNLGIRSRTAYSMALVAIALGCHPSRVEKHARLEVSLDAVVASEAIEIDKIAQKLWSVIETRDLPQLAALVEDRAAYRYLTELMSDSTLDIASGRGLRMTTARRPAPESDVVFAQFVAPLPDCFDGEGRRQPALLGFAFENRRGWKVTGVYSPRGECRDVKGIPGDGRRAAGNPSRVGPGGSWHL